MVERREERLVGDPRVVDPAEEALRRRVVQDVVDEAAVRGDVHRAVTERHVHRVARLARPERAAAEDELRPLRVAPEGRGETTAILRGVAIIAVFTFSHTISNRYNYD